MVGIDAAVDELAARGVEHYDLPDLKTDGRGIFRGDSGSWATASFRDPAGHVTEQPVQPPNAASTSVEIRRRSQGAHDHLALSSHADEEATAAEVAVQLTWPLCLAGGAGNRTATRGAATLRAGRRRCEPRVGRRAAGRMRRATDEFRGVGPSNRQPPTQGAGS